MSAINFDAFWRDHGVQKGLKDLSTHASKAHQTFRQLDRGAGIGFGNIAKGVGLVGGAVAKFGLGAGVAFGAAGVAAAGFGVKVASGNEQAKISFTTMLGSAKRANVFLKQLQQFAAKTPFEFPELQTAASSLISVGIKADKIIPIMTSLGNATSGMGTGAEGVKRATVALQQMTAAGRITAEDLNQLRDAGIPVFDLLTKATGKTTAEIAKMAANGKLGKKELQQLMAALESGKGLERFAGLMDKQSQSLAGLWSTFKDTAGQMLAGLATTAFPLMKSGLAAVSTELGHLGAWVKDNRDSLGTVFKVLGSTLTTLGGTVSTVFKSFAQSAGLGKGSFKDFADFIATHQEDITRGIIAGGKVFIGFGKVIAMVASGGLRAFGGLADGVNHVLSFIIDRYAEMSHGFAVIFGQGPLGKGIRDADARFQAFAAHARGDIGKTGDSARALADGLDKRVIPAFDKAGRGLDAFGKKSIASAHARDLVTRAEVGYRKAVDAASSSVKTYGKGLDNSTVGTQKNRAALNNLVTASQTYISRLITAHASSKKVTAATADARAEFVRVAVKMGVARDRAKELAAKYFAVPKGVKTTVTQPGMQKARDQTKGLDGDINNLNSKSVSVHVQVNTSLNKLNTALVRKYGAGAVKMALAEGGPVPGFSPHPKADNIPIMATAREFMQPVSAVDYYGVNTMERIRKRQIPREAIQHLAGGGTVSRNITERVNAAGVVYNYGKLRDYATTESSAAGRAMANDLGGQATRAAAAAAIAAAKAARAAAQAATTASGYSGPLPGGRGAAGIRAIARALGASYIAHHIDPQGGNAYDLGSSGARNTRIGNALVSAHGRLGLRYVIRQMQIASARSSWNWRRYSPITGSGDFRHVNHVHVSYDRGGYLRREDGNGTRRPERVLSPVQTRSFDHLVRVMDRGRGGVGNTTIVIHAPNYIGSRSELKQTLVSMAKGGDFDVVLARAGGR